MRCWWFRRGCAGSSGRESSYITRAPTKTQHTIIMHIVAHWKITSKPFSLQSAAHAMSRLRNPLNSSLHMGHDGAVAVSLRCCQHERGHVSDQCVEYGNAGAPRQSADLMRLDQSFETVHVDQSGFPFLVTRARREHVLGKCRHRQSKAIKGGAPCGQQCRQPCAHLGIIRFKADTTLQLNLPRASRRLRWRLHCSC